MKTIVLAGFLLILPYTAIAAGFCAATYRNDRAVITAPRDATSPKALENDFQTLLAARGIKPELKGCLISEADGDQMKQKMLEIQKLGYTIQIIEW